MKPVGKSQGTDPNEPAKFLLQNFFSFVGCQNKKNKKMYVGCFVPNYRTILHNKDCYQSTKLNLMGNIGTLSTKT